MPSTEILESDVRTATGAIVDGAPPPMVIPANVDIATGPIDTERDVVVQGSVLDLMRLTSGGTVQVGRAIEAAEVRAARDIEVNGGIAGKDKGRCVASRDVRARFINNARIEAGRDVVAEAEVTHGRIICGGRLSIRDGSLLAAHVTALGGVECRVLGSPAGSMTLVEAGFDEVLRQMAATHLPKILADRKRIAKIRLSIEPLMRNPKTLTASQKEQATELLFEASEAEEATNALLAQLRARRDEAATRARAEVRVLEAVHAGVVIRFRDLEATLPHTVAGPLRIATAATARQIVLELLDDSGRQLQLDSRPRTDPDLEALDRELAQRA